MKTRNLKFEYGPSKKSGEFHWRIRAKNGQIIAQGEGYKRKRSALRVFTLLQDAFEHFFIDTVELDERGKPIPQPAYVGTIIG